MIHPFQTDQGTSQRQRLTENLLSGPAQIDPRSLAELLVYFEKLSRNVNYYDENLTISNWQPFFRKSLPFTIATIVKFDREADQNKLAAFRNKFERKPSPEGLQLLLNYTNNNLIKKIKSWHKLIEDGGIKKTDSIGNEISESGIPFQAAFDKIIKDKLSGPVKEFIKYANTSTKWYCTRNFNFNSLLDNQVWLLTNKDLVTIDVEFINTGTTRRKRLIALYNKVSQLVQSFLDVIRLLSVAAEMSMEQSLIPLKEEFQERHPPHLAIIFAFIKLFQHLQEDLNKQTRRHLDFFYKEVLKLKPVEATPDKVNLVFEIQKQLDQYLLKKGLLLKDGKDNNKAEVYFATDDEIVVNKTQVVDQRTLFLNNQVVKRHVSSDCEEMAVAEGVYMAPDATKANGIDKEFTDDLPSRATLGNKWSKYIDPENKFTYPYPNARLGFILASPVLLLNEGTRTITITLHCELEHDYCKSLLPQIGILNPCCDNPAPPSGIPTIKNNDYPPFLESDKLLADVSAVLNKTYYYISRELIAKAVKKGISKDLQEKLNRLLIIKHIREANNPPSDTDILDPNLCFCSWEEKLYEITLPAIAEFSKGFEQIFTPGEREILKDFFKPRKALNVLFSGDKEWIAAKPPEPGPLEILIFSTAPLVGNLSFTLIIKAKLLPDQPAVTFYNAENLKEDFNTTLPLVKIELDDKIKLVVPTDSCKGSSKACCEKEISGDTREVSLYHFFRNVKLLPATKIDVQVCGLKNLIVQNDENVENVNSLVHPFGARPEVGANFYIGSQEIFSKNWQQIWVNAEWKDKPDLEINYKFYDYGAFEDGTFKITDSSFLRTHAVLENGVWKTENPTPSPFTRRLFNDPTTTVGPMPICGHVAPAINDKDNIDQYHFQRNVLPFDFINTIYEKRDAYSKPLTPLNITSDYGFLRLTLEGVGFQHNRYAFVVARHMMVLSNLVDPTSIPEIIKQLGEAKDIISVIINKINSIPTNLGTIQTKITTALAHIGVPPSPTSLFQQLAKINALLTTLGPGDINSAKAIANLLVTSVGNPLVTALNNIKSEKDAINDIINLNPGINFVFANYNSFGLNRLAQELQLRLLFIDSKIKGDPDLKYGLPKEPYTPAIKELSVDYEAIADINDIKLIHLYPFKDTYKPESLSQQPMLFPTFCDEGNFFIGLKDLVPGSNVNILFQLAEATADSESEREDLMWYYLENNAWKLLRTGFEVLDDDTNGLTTSGIIKFSLPANMTSDNSILPKGLHWIKASIPAKSKSVSEIFGIHTQAIKATFTNDVNNDKLRLSKSLPAGSVAKLKDADSSVKKITQPYDSFGGREPEEEKHFYIRTHELLRHKNRAIQKFDYERLTLEAFPQIYKVKCINHSYALDANKYFNDFPMAPGYVLIAVIPDLNILKAAKSFEPKVPVSMLEDIAETLKKVTSPFVRLWIKNPRYEKVNFCLRIKLLPEKDEVYYKEKVKQDIREFLAPWAIGEYSKLTFGQPISRSDIIQFLESRDYLDYIIDLRMIHADKGMDIKLPVGEEQEIVPITPRSILIAGSIDVCIDAKDCETWCKCNDAVDNKLSTCCDHEKIPVMEYCSDQIKS
ncbi:MAG: baseplate J/gp47 family protein [Saprospiraceae bacterium]|uniref:Baseplate J/gp47 family protein n=1 Tax=Candidatus Opimibacter skivensis TaxID=2982028 RepID=A0A9D7SVG2_9BACT|nr:baseplate J/gp47 family protein [Candidatus Opimibacter skivensis]